MAAEKTGATDDKSAGSISSAGNGSSGGSKLPVIIAIINLLATVGMVAILFISFQRDKQHPSVDDITTHGAEAPAGEKAGEHGEGGEGAEHKESTKKKPVEFGKMVTLEQFTVNLSTPGSVNPKFVRVNISLEVPNDEIEAEVTSKMPQVRNVIIDLFNSKRPADLATPDGRDYLKEEIRNTLNTFLVTGKVKGVFFTSFALAG